MVIFSLCLAPLSWESRQCCFLREAERFYVAMSSCSRTIPGLDACGEENFDGFGDTEDIDATKSLLDIGMETEEEELGEESPNEEHCEEGFRDRKWLEMQDWKREHKVFTCCGCQVEMRIKQKAESNNWYVCRFVDEHNHDLLLAKFVSYLPAYRKISDVDRAHMDSLRQVGISIPKIYESIAA
ncbi:hypothetical protein AHAS_Ahas18G0175200 [Arachis hypogaea]